MQRTFLLLALVFVSLAVVTKARPYRQKRVSDQRIAELETLIALQKMKGKLVTVPVGFGKFNLQQMGRRRRSLPLGIPDVPYDKDISPQDLALLEYFLYNDSRPEADEQRDWEYPEPVSRD